MLHTSLYMYIAKFLNVCIWARSSSRLSSCIPYLKTYFGSDACERVSVKKKEQKNDFVLRVMKFVPRGKARSTLSLLQTRVNSSQVTTYRRGKVKIIATKMKK